MISSLVTCAAVVLGGVSSLAADGLPAFPGAEGFGAMTPGGRGGRVIKVTNLNPSGAGSLQAACSARGPRIVVFDVSGVIRGDVRVEHGRITIAGQTAPGGGITIEGRLTTRYRPPQPITDVVVRFLRVRPPPSTGVTGDALSMHAQRLVIDHVSCSWATDETIDIYEAKDVTVQWCTVEESDTRGHPKGRHNYGLISGPEGERVSIHHCLFAHHSRRCPAIANGPADFRNNVVYNFNHGFSHEGHPPNGKWYNCVGNYYKKGPSAERIFIVATQRGRSYYIADNFIEGIGLIGDPRGPGRRFPDWIQLNSYGGVLKEAVKVPPVKTHTARQARELVLTKAGCFPRDVVTKRIIEETKSGTGSWGRHAPGDLMQGLTPARPPRDSDGDGMPDEWESRHGLNPGVKDHNARTQSGYTAIEEYVNEVASALIGEKPPEKKEKAPDVWSLVVRKLSRKGAPAGDPLGAYATLIEDARGRALSGGFEEAARTVEELAAGAENDKARATLARLARGLRATEELRRWIVDGSAAGRREKVFVDFMGRPMRAAVLRADERGLTATCFDNELEVPWEKLPPRRFLALARRYAAEGKGGPSSARAELLEDFAFAFGIGDG